MRFLLTLARAYPWRTAFTLFAMLLAGVMEGIGLLLLLPMLSAATGDENQGDDSSLFGFGGLVTDTIRAFGITPSVGPLLIVIVACILLKSVLLLLARTQVGYTVAHVATDLRSALLRALLAARWEYYVRQPIGSLANAVGSEAIRASAGYLYGATVVALLIQASIYAGVALLVSWEAASAALLSAAVVLVALSRLMRMAQQAGTRQTQLLGSLSTRLIDSLQSVKPLKAMAREDLVGPVLETENKRLNRALQKQVISMEALSSSQEPMVAIILAVGLYVALIHWGMPINTVMVMVLLLARLLTHLAKVQRQYQTMLMYDSAFWSLQSTIDNARRASEGKPGGLLPSLEHSLRIEGVTFAYGDTQVLQRASLSIPAGTFTALVGPSGVGKSTIADLITGLLRPQQGQILVDGVPLQDIDLRRWRRMIGYVPQDTFLLHDTVLHNVTLGDPTLMRADAETALRAAGAWDFVAAMPQGIVTSVGERGTALSGGQRQRIAIARALAHQPKLLILDEITSALDRESEAAICRTLQQLRGRLTILAISHQPVLVEAAERVYRLQNGTALLIVDGGTPVAASQTIPGETNLAEG